VASVPASCSGGQLGGVAGRLDDVDQVARGELRRGGDVGPFGTQVDGGGDAGHLVQLGLHPGGAGGAGHPADDQLEPGHVRRGAGLRARRRHIRHLALACGHRIPDHPGARARAPALAEIDVDVAAGRVRITGQFLPDDAGLRDAVEEADYEFAG
jgi:hypothetical protein